MNRAHPTLHDNHWMRHNSGIKQAGPGDRDALIPLYGGGGGGGAWVLLNACLGAPDHELCGLVGCGPTQASLHTESWLITIIKIVQHRGDIH